MSTYREWPDQFCYMERINNLTDYPHGREDLEITMDAAESAKAILRAVLRGNVLIEPTEPGGVELKLRSRVFSLDIVIGPDGSVISFQGKDQE